MVFVATACVVDDAGRPTAEAQGTPRDTMPMRICEDAHAPTSEPTQRWRHWSTSLITWAAPAHAGIDAIVGTGEDAVLRAKLAYGAMGKDLEDEWVEVWIDRCDELELVDVALTDSDGRIAVELDTDELGAAARHRVHYRVVGDGSVVSSTLLVLPKGSRIAVFDIDGTLTTSDMELFRDLADDLFRPIFHGEAPAARDGAAETTWARAEQGYPILYLTGRPYWLTARSREWLDDEGIAPGVLVTTQRSADTLPLESGVGDYKAEVLAEIQLAGIDIDVAYGNATTDIYAYAEAGIELATTFILGEHGGEEGTVALGESYAAHLDDADFGSIEQPFD